MEDKSLCAWLILVACGSSILAFSFPIMGGFIFIYPISIILLSQRCTLKSSLYLGFVIGLLTTAYHLFFFSGIFGPLAFLLWSVLGIWLSLFSASANLAFKRFGSKAYFLMPFFWLFFEYFRSEIYVLKFSWLAPGMALSHRYWNFLASYGFYGATFLVLTLFSAMQMWRSSRRFSMILLIIGMVILGNVPTPYSEIKSGPIVSGIQMEHLNRGAVLNGLNKLITHKPETQLVVLSEYTFRNGVSDIFRDWCKLHNCYLMVGSTDPLSDGKFRNTVFVIDPQGKTVFKQGKSVPIQFFRDGEPANSQEIWNSPWGKIGIAICYDLSYTKVIDRLVEKGAEMLIIPTMDSADWGAYQHNIHSFLAPVRAREYQIPIFRLASSGVSQVVSDGGLVLKFAPYPGRGAIISSHLMYRSGGGSVPMVRRYMGLILTVATIGLLLLLVKKSTFLQRLKLKRKTS